MKTAYTPDNTRATVVAMLVVAAIITAAVVLIGGNEKPDVATIMIVPAAVGEAPAASETFGFGTAEADDTTDGDDGTVLLDEFGEPFGDTTGDAAANEQTDQTDTTDDTSTAESGTTDEDEQDDGARVPQGEVIVVPTSEPTPTPEVAAAVAPTPTRTAEAADDAEADAGATTSLSMPAAAGSVQGSFFTKGDENEGATVAQNLITLDFAEDGTGSFQGVLEITYGDDTHVLLNMSGPLTLAPTNPQVETTLTGAFTLDSTIDTDDVTTSDAELSISSLAAGSGSLCTTKCFGFTFPPQ